MNYNNEIEMMVPYDIPDVLEAERKAFGSMAWRSNDFESAIVSSYDFPFIIHRHPVGNADDEEQYAGNLAGYSILRLLGPEAEVENICVSGDMRRCGIGEKLMHHMINTAIEHDAATIFLEVRSCNEAARKLYSKMGFTESYIRKAYYRDPVDDAIIMSLKLTP
ncbi:ribosomal protein S18-alanine N-acetyltransferase [Oribacterium sp. WCC10]|uniref:ribosomal protein S18-alanine N-acetyltransferase n=1 Tax=Oribacterium sp. WCC10 TaxID=1855343 RepID=UPI0008E4A465|nr:ribosomal protein S18-alanine N-acetyltransferase [Oribacterium sp. WCC10]SFG50546.1 ribosomal-protein-alanine N-acetyltransferase [Oribacterium sp. WCC10]